jgi:hypothetical protein
MNLAYSTYLGGSVEDLPHGIAAGPGGVILLCGHTDSSNFPTQAAFQTSLAGGRDAFIAAFDSSGSILVFSSYFGGTGSDIARAIATDDDGEAYCGGHTGSADFPTVNAFQAAPQGSNDAFIVKLSSDGSALEYSTYLGGSGSDVAYGIAVDDSGAVAIAGSSASSDFPTMSPYQASFGGGARDAFSSILSPDGSRLLFSSYVGGSNDDVAYGADMDSAGRICLVGSTKSMDFPTQQAYQSMTNGVDSDAFVTVIDPSSASLIFSTYLGGRTGYPPWAAPEDYAWAVDADSSGAWHVAGVAWSLDFPTLNSYQAVKGNVTNYDGFVSKFDSQGALLYSTYLGGNDRDFAYGIGADSQGRVWVGGETYSFNFPVKNSYQRSHAGSLYSYDGFVSVFSQDGALLASTYLGGSADDTPYALALDLAGNAYITGGTSSNDFPTLSPYQAGRSGSADVFVSKFFALTTPTPSPSPSPSPTPSPSPSPTPSPTASPTPSPSPSPSPTATPSTTPTPSPSPSPTIRLCFGVEGKVMDRGNSQAIAGALVRIVVPNGVSSVVSADADGDYSAVVCTHIPDGQLIAQARHRDYLPAQSESSYADWSAPGRYDVSLSRGAKLQGIADGDYNGDGTADLAVYRAGLGFWAVRDLTRAYYGLEKDEPCPGDYNGDGTAEMAIFRAGSALWAIRDLTRIYFGDFVDVPVPADYDGEGTTGIAIFRSTTGLWGVRDETRKIFGIPDDQPVPGRYNVNGGASPAIYRSQSGYWSVRDLSIWYFGTPGDRVVPGDYDGEGYWRPAIYRPSSGLWAVWGGGRWTMDSGLSLRALPADYNGDGIEEAATFWDSSGRWSIRGMTTIYFGMTGDIPATR